MPELPEILNIFANCGRRKSKPISSTFLSAIDSIAAVFTLTNVFPSPDMVEVTNTTLSVG